MSLHKDTASTIVVEYIKRQFRHDIRLNHYTTKIAGHEFSIDIAVIKKIPNINLDAHMTVGLSRYKLYSSPKVPVHIELLTMSTPNTKNAVNLPLMVSSYFMDYHICLEPGSCLKDIISFSGINTNHLEHVYFTLPLVWGYSFDKIYTDEYIIHFLMPIGISNDEYFYIQNYGPDKFETLLLQSSVNIFDFNRTSIIR